MNQLEAENTIRMQSALLALRDYQGDSLDPFLQLTTREVARALNVARASVWFFDHERSAIVCQDLYLLAAGEHSRGMRLEAAQFPAYFEAAATRSALVAHTAQTDPATCEFTETYLKPLGITSMLDVPIWSGEQLHGVVCCEHVGPPREWTPEEVRFAVSVTSYLVIELGAAQRRRAEESLRIKNQQLEQAIESEQLAYQKLKEAQGALVQTEKLAALGQMIAGVAHEINNPLSFVVNNVAVLERDSRALAELMKLYAGADPVIEKNDEVCWTRIKELSDRIDLKYTLNNLKELTSRSREGLKRIQQIVFDLRDFARLDQGDQHEVDLNVGIQSAVSIISGRGKGKCVEIVKELNPLPTITCHAAKINQVVMNLLANAIDASNAHGKVTICSSACAGQILISVSDTGHGIDPSIREHIFDPFFTTKPPGQGTGLGLSISYGIIQEHGGRIAFDSTVGAGATFTVSLPIARPHTANHRLPADD